jgi:hypothetical protein
MPNRIIKESICSSEDINALSWFEEVLFYRLITACDDYGRMDARPAILRARLFPLRDVTNKQIDAALSKLVTVGMVRVYKYDRQLLLQLENWGKHQRLSRPSRARGLKFFGDIVVVEGMHELGILGIKQSFRAG